MLRLLQRRSAARGTVAGHHLPPARPTRWAAIHALVWLGLPLVLLLLVADVALYLVVTRLLGRCYGILCLLG